MRGLDGTERARRLWEKGRSLANISATLGVGPWRARRLLHAAGVVGAADVARCGFARRLRAYRLAAGLTQQELAERAGLNATTVWQYEQGETAPRSSSLARLAAVLGEGLAL